jgi:hypothetical protein
MPTREPMTDTSGARRVALVVSKALSPGQAANVSALLMGQLATLDADLYAPPVAGADGHRHAGIRHSTVVLRGGPGQIATLAGVVREAGLSMCVFSAAGQALNNAFDQYKALLENEPDTDLVGVGLVGRDEDVRTFTRKFSLLA